MLVSSKVLFSPVMRKGLKKFKLVMNFHFERVKSFFNGNTSVPIKSNSYFTFYLNKMDSQISLMLKASRESNLFVEKRMALVPRKKKCLKFI